MKNSMKKFCASFHYSCLVWLLMTKKPALYGTAEFRSYDGNVQKMLKKSSKQEIDEKAHFKFINRHY